MTNVSGPSRVLIDKRSTAAGIGDTFVDDFIATVLVVEGGVEVADPAGSAAFFEQTHLSVSHKVGDETASEFDPHDPTI